MAFVSAIYFPNMKCYIMHKITFHIIFLVWLTHHALQVTKRVEHLPRFYLEQPCQTYEECLVIRNRCSLPIILGTFHKLQ